MGVHSEIDVSHKPVNSMGVFLPIHARVLGLQAPEQQQVGVGVEGDAGVEVGGVGPVAGRAAAAVPAGEVVSVRY